MFCNAPILAFYRWGFIFLYFSRKDGSKEPIVEMRTEDERITNHEDGSPVNEPNETTPLAYDFGVYFFTHSNDTRYSLKFHKINYKFRKNL